jgi:L-aminopeptidase/D-esterase-like protein
MKNSQSNSTIEPTLTSIKGVRVGHAEDKNAFSGTTVVLFDKPSVTACDARGGWPGTYDTNSVEVGKAFYRKRAIFLTGGDVFGLDAATGIRRFLLENNMATLNPGEMPGIVGANIYDLGFAKGVESVSYADLGYRACLSAASTPVAQGNFGAGIGATVGKLRSRRFCWKGGVGSTATKILNERIEVGAIVITNSIGNVFDPSTGKTIAGTRYKEDSAGEAEFCELVDIIPEYLKAVETSWKKRKEEMIAPKATTIGVVVTNAKLTHEETIKIAQMAHDGLARVIRPVHAMTDGDTLFAVSTGEVELDGGGYALVDVIGELSAQQVSKAVLNSVLNAAPLGGIPGLWVKN